MVRLGTGTRVLPINHLDFDQIKMTKIKVGEKNPETFLAVQWLRLRASTAGGMGLIPGCCC